MQTSGELQAYTDLTRLSSQERDVCALSLCSLEFSCPSKVPAAVCRRQNWTSRATRSRHDRLLELLLNSVEHANILFFAVSQELARLLAILCTGIYVYVQIVVLDMLNNFVQGGEQGC